VSHLAARVRRAEAQVLALKDSVQLWMRDMNKGFSELRGMVESLASAQKGTSMMGT